MNDATQNFYEFENFRLDAGRCVLYSDGSVVNLTPKALEILRLLVERAGDIVSKEEIFERVWPDSFVEEANLSHHVFKLRKALGETDERKLIETVPKRGYRFVGVVNVAQVVEAEPASVSPGFGLKVPVLVLVLLAAGAFAWFWFSSEPADTSTTVTASEVSTLAVLPFVNETGDDEVEYLADGLAETLIGRLSGIESIRVRPYSYVSRFRKHEMAPEDVGKDLKVSFLLSGRLTKRGDTVRLFLSLVDVASGYQTWGKEYERDVGSIAVLEQEIIRDVSQYLPAKLSGPDQDKILAAPARDNEAYLHYLKGRYHLNRKTVDGLEKAVDEFNRAAEIDPSYALAYSGLADAYSQMGLWVRMPPDKTFPKAKAAAERALSLNSGLAEARTSLAYAKFYYEWDFAGAEAELRQAIQENPNYTLAREAYGVLIYETNPSRFEEAMVELNTATKLDPLAMAPYFWRGAIYYFEGNFDLAHKELDEVWNIDPNYTLGNALKGAVFREQADTQAYLDLWLRASPLEGVDLTKDEIEELRSVHRNKGLRFYEIAYAELLQRKAEHSYVSPIFVAMHYSLAGEKDLAFQWLEKAMAERSSWLVELKVDPAWKNLHSDERYLGMLNRIGFPQ